MKHSLQDRNLALRPLFLVLCAGHYAEGWGYYISVREVHKGVWGRHAYTFQMGAPWTAPRRGWYLKMGKA